MAKFETLVDIFRTSIKTFPDRELFGTKKDGVWRWTTYLEFGRMVDKLRAGLDGLGIGHGDHVAIISNNRVEWAVGQYACLGLGAGYVPMYEAQNAKEWDFILRDCEAKAVICATDKIVKKIQDAGIPSIKIIISLDPQTAAEGNVHRYADLLKSDRKVASREVSKDDLACLIYTSGTTGNPKGVMLTHGNIASNVSACHDILFIASDDRSLSFLPWAHVFGQTGELHLLFSSGASMALCESVDKLLENLAEVRPTFLMSVPRIFNRIYTSVQRQIAERPAVIQTMVKTAIAARQKQRDGGQLSLAESLVVAVTDKLVFSKVRARFGGRLRFAVSGGAALSKDVAEFISGLGITVFEGYGLTETSPVVTVNYPNNIRIGSVGRPLADIRVHIEDDGEIVVYGPNVMKGYFNRPDENAAVFKADGGFRTGDMGKIVDGYLYITGRIKEQYKLENGKYVVPTPLEEAFKLSGFIAGAFVYGDNKPFNVALIVPNFDAVRSWGKDHGVSETDAKKLAEDPKVFALLKGEVDKYGAAFKGFEGIKAFALLAEDFSTENGMLTPSMKVKRKKVVETYIDKLNALYTQKIDKSDRL